MAYFTAVPVSMQIDFKVCLETAMRFTVLFQIFADIFLWPDY